MTTMRLAAACRNTSVSRTTGTAPESMMSAKHLPRPDRRELVDIADDKQRGIVRCRLHQSLHQHDVDHRGLVDDQQIAIEGIVGVALEPPALGIDLQEPMDRLRLD